MALDGTGVTVWRGFGGGSSYSLFVRVVGLFSRTFSLFTFFLRSFFAYFCIPWPGSVWATFMSPNGQPEGLDLNSIPAKILVYVLSNPMPNNLPTKRKSKSNSLPPLQSSRALAM